jgi:hypothetical protein
LGLMTASGAFFLIVSLAVRGHLWAAAVSIAVGGFLLVVLMQVLFFTAAWFAALLIDRLWPKQIIQSPFAEFRPPPQLIAPEQPD